MFVNFSVSSRANEVSSCFIVSRARENYYCVTNYVSSFYIQEYDNDKNEGDIIYIEGNSKDLDFITIEKDFNFEEFLNKLNIYKKIEIKKEKIILECFIDRKATIEHFNKTNLLEPKNIFSSLLFSTSSSDEINFLYNDLNIIYLLSSNGYFLSIFIELIYFIFENKMKKKYSKVISLVSFMPLFMFNMFDFAYFRIFASKLYNLRQKKSQYLEKIGILSLIYLSIYPSLAFTTTFLLSTILPILFYLLNKYLKKDKKIFRIIKIKFIVFLFLVPINIKFNNQINLLSIVYQFLFIDIFFVIFIIGICSLYLGRGLFLRQINDLFVKLSKNLNHHGVNLYFNDINVYVSILYYVLFLILILMLEKRLFNFVKNYVITIYVGILISAIPIKNSFTSNVYFINVGQGDSILIRERNETILIDTGGSIYKDISLNLIKFLRSEKIYNIDHLAITHNDYDHCGAKDDLIKKYNVKNILNRNDFPLTFSNFVIHNLNNVVSDDENESSLVLYFDTGSKKILLMGDAPISVEKNIINAHPHLKCDILKIGHHGSKTSTSEEFLKQLEPKEAIISAGKKNNYSHPDEEVIARLNKNTIRIRKTYEEGTIIYNL